MPRFAKGLLAQSVEQLTFNQLVLGSSPRQPTILRLSAAEVKDAPLSWGGCQLATLEKGVLGG